MACARPVSVTSVAAACVVRAGTSELKYSVLRVSSVGLPFAPITRGVASARAVSCWELWFTITRRPTGRKTISVIAATRIAVFTRWNAR